MFKLLPRVSLQNTKLLLISFLLMSTTVLAQTAIPELVGVWRINEKQSDDTDNKVEAALRKSGEKIRRSWFDRNKEYYRGGPAEQELYDRISYDPNLTIQAEGDHFRFEYNDGFARTVYTDNRSRNVSLTEIDSEEDFSLGHVVEATFVVEAHPRDGGFTSETYRILEGGNQLEAVFSINPQGFQATVELRRVYDRVR